MIKIYLDLETIPGQSPDIIASIANTITPPGNYKNPETIAKWEEESKPTLIQKTWRDTALKGNTGEIICIGWAFENEPVQSIVRALDEPEAKLILKFFEFIDARLKSQWAIPCWIGHNIQHFDLRFLFQRAVIVGVKPPFPLPWDMRHGSEFIYDTMIAWAGWKDRISLDALSKALGFPAKGAEIGEDSMDGSRVWDLVQAGRLNDVATYCRGDVEKTRQIHKRLIFDDQDSDQRLKDTVTAGQTPYGQA